MKSAEPYVSMRPSRHDGVYRLAKRPLGMAAHNAESWQIVESILASRGCADYRDLAVAVRGHKKYGKFVCQPQEFIGYCIDRQWLERAH